MLLGEILQLPAKTWCPDANPVMATLTVVGEYKQGQYGFEQPIQLKDDSGVSSEVVCQSKYEKGLMAPNMVGVRARWRLKWFQGRAKQVIVGYCLDKITVSGQAPPFTQALQAPQAAPQPAQAPPQAAQGPPLVINTQTPTHAARAVKPQPRDYDAENRGKCRYGIVCAYISAGVDPDIPTVDYWVDYAMTGQTPLPPARQQAAELLGKPAEVGPPPVDQQWEH